MTSTSTSRGRVTAAAKPVRVNPAGLGVESLHHSPLLAVGPGGEIYLSWSSDRPKPDGVLFASDLRLSRSLDGGRTLGAAISASTRTAPSRTRSRAWR